MRFSSKTVLVTGASLGVGRACAHQFHAEGANVVLVARREEPLQRAVEGLDPERVLIQTGDVADLDRMLAVLDASVARFGAVHGLVNNAGAHFRGEVTTRTPEELATMVDVNLRAPIALTRAVLPLLRDAGGGFVVNVASLAGCLPLEGSATYSATKFGLRAFTFALAEELRDEPITLSAVSPGPIDTTFITDNLDDVSDMTLSQPMCTADDVAAMVLDCAADGRRERVYPKLGARLATLSYLWPGLRRLVKPALARKGRKVRERLKRERGDAG